MLYLYGMGVEKVYNNALASMEHLVGGLLPIFNTLVAQTLDTYYCISCRHVKGTIGTVLVIQYSKLCCMFVMYMVE